MLHQGDLEEASAEPLRPLAVPAPTLVRLASSPPTPIEGRALILTASVVTIGHDGVRPTGLVAFRAGHRLLGTARIDATGAAVLRDVTLPTGLHAIIASYGGDAAHAAATSAPLPQAVAPRAAAVRVVVAAPVRTRDAMVLEAELLDAATGRLVEEATGSFVFALGGRAIGSAPLEGGQARMVMRGEPLEGDVSARYDGDPEHAAAAGTYVGAQ